MKYLLLLILLMTSVVLMAANPAGRVTSSGPLTLNGKAVPATAATSLPVVAGDEIVTSDSMATIFFADKSRATIEPNSRVKLEARSSSLALRVLAGSADLKRAEGSRISLIEPARSATRKSALSRAAASSVAQLGKDDKPPSRSRPCPPSNPHCQ